MFDLEKNQKALFDTNRKCKFCGFDCPHPKRPTSCPAWGKECRKCLQKNRFSRCCKEEKFKDSKKTVKATWRLCESSESSDSDEGTVRHVYETDSRTHERVIVKVEEKPVDFISDTGSSSMIMNKQTYLDFKKNQDIPLNKTGIKLTPYGSDNPLHLLGKFRAKIE
jgi:hypothetical protein